MDSQNKPPAEIAGHCPECGPRRYANVLFEHVEASRDEYTWDETKYRVLQCAGCRTTYFQRLSTFSEHYETDEDPNTGEPLREYIETIKYWPSTSARRRPTWVQPWRFEPVLYNILSETYDALNNDSRILGGTGIRTVFDRASENLGVDPSLPFSEKLSRLHEAGKIGLEERDHLAVLTDAGSAAAHRAWQPTPDEIDVLMDIMEGFLYRTFIVSAQVLTLKARIPERQKRLRNPE